MSELAGSSWRGPRCKSPLGPNKAIVTLMCVFTHELMLQAPSKNLKPNPKP